VALAAIAAVVRVVTVGRYAACFDTCLVRVSPPCPPRALRAADVVVAATDVATTTAIAAERTIAVVGAMATLAVPLTPAPNTSISRVPAGASLTRNRAGGIVPRSRDPVEQDDHPARERAG